MKIEDLKKLPVIPNTGARTIKKKNFTDLGPKGNFLSLDERDDEEDTDEREMTELNVFEFANSSIDHTRPKLDEENTTVFDLVHRGRQRQ